MTAFLKMFAMKLPFITLIKIPTILKLVVYSSIIFSAAAVGDLPVHDPWFDVVLIMWIGSIVNGQPEPDLWGKISVSEFLYLWFYRSSHLFISAATAYLIHKNKWSEISGSPYSYPAVDRRRKPQEVRESGDEFIS